MPMGFLPNLGLTELAVVAVGTACLAVPVWGVIDAAQRPEKQWAAVGASRTTWIVLMAVFGLLCAPAGLAIAGYYLAALRPRLSRSGGDR